MAAFKSLHSKNKKGGLIPTHSQNLQPMIICWQQHCPLFIWRLLYLTFDCNHHAGTDPTRRQGNQMMWLLCAPVSSNKHSTSICCHSDDELHNATVCCLYICLLYWSLSSSCVSFANQINHRRKDCAPCPNSKVCPLICCVSIIISCAIVSSVYISDLFICHAYHAGSRYQTFAWHNFKCEWQRDRIVDWLTKYKAHWTSTAKLKNDQGGKYCDKTVDDFTNNRERH